MRQVLQTMPYRISMFVGPRGAWAAPCSVVEVLHGMSLLDALEATLVLDAVTRSAEDADG